jgi:hypothetical protein
MSHRKLAELMRAFPICATRTKAMEVNSDGFPKQIPLFRTASPSIVKHVAQQFNFTKVASCRPE